MNENIIGNLLNNPRTCIHANMKNTHTHYTHILPAHCTYEHTHKQNPYSSHSKPKSMRHILSGKNNIFLTIAPPMFFTPVNFFSSFQRRFSNHIPSTCPYRELSCFPCKVWETPLILYAKVTNC